MSAVHHWLVIHWLLVVHCSNCFGRSKPSAMELANFSILDDRFCTCSVLCCLSIWSSCSTRCLSISSSFFAHLMSCTSRGSFLLSFFCLHWLNFSSSNALLCWTFIAETPFVPLVELKCHDTCTYQLPVDIFCRFCYLVFQRDL